MEKQAVGFRAWIKRHAAQAAVFNIFCKRAN